MNEITIGDKIYISSKRAAEITGYAKDYVGQLCREGHIDAKMVGRGWYVYEPSIRSHRFGDTTADEGNEKNTVAAAGDQMPSVAESWQTPVYSPEPVEMLPKITVAESVSSDTEDEMARQNETLRDMQEAWKDWFSSNQQAALETPEAISVREHEGDATVKAQNTDLDERIEEITFRNDSEVEPPSDYEIEPRISSIEPDETSDEILLEVPQKVRPIVVDMLQPNKPYKALIHDDLIPARRATAEMPVTINHVSASAQHQARIVTERIIRKGTKGDNVKGSNAPVVAVLIGVAVIAVSAALVGSGILQKYTVVQSVHNPIIDFLVGNSTFNR